MLRKREKLKKYATFLSFEYEILNPNCLYFPGKHGSGVEREREHEVMDNAALQSMPTIQALRTCGLLKFFCTSPMRANVRILEFLVNYWDHELGMFNIQGETLELTMEDIYFITGL